MNTPAQTTAAAFPRNANAQVTADSAPLHWPGLYVRRFRFSRVVDRFLVPATAEPLISCVVAGTAEFQERDLGAAWITRQLGRGDLFVTRSKVPYEVRATSPAGRELDFVAIHLSTDEYRAALEAVYPGCTEGLDVLDFFGRDPALAHLCFACAEMLAARVPGDTHRVGALTRFFAAHLVENYLDANAAPAPGFRGGLPIRQLRQVEDYVSDHLAEEIPVEALAALVHLSTFHFSRVFRQATGMSPLQFVTRGRITRAQQLIRETSRSLIDIALEVGYTSPSHFAQVFRRVAGVTPTRFRRAL